MAAAEAEATAAGEALVDKVLTKVVAEEEEEERRRRRRKLCDGRDDKGRRPLTDGGKEEGEGETNGSPSASLRLHRSEAAVRDLQSSLRTERENGLEWMAKHNKERDQVSQGCTLHTHSTNIRFPLKRRLLQAEMDELKRELRWREEEKAELDKTAEEDRRQTRLLQEAVRCEAENYRKLKATLADERQRSKSASDRDSDTILELRTALEVERERGAAEEAKKARKKQQETEEGEVIAPEVGSITLSKKSPCNYAHYAS